MREISITSHQEGKLWLEDFDLQKLTIVNTGVERCGLIICSKICLVSIRARVEKGDKLEVD